MLQERAFQPDPAGRIVPVGAMAALQAAFPQAPARFGHRLRDEPLLSLDLLADAAGRMNPAHVEVRRSRNANGTPFAFAEAGGRDPAATIRQIGQAHCWVMLRFAEQLPEYAQLLHRMLDEIEPLTRRFGPPVQPRAFIFISSPGTLTPFHFDPEFNILFQIAGHKRFATYPVAAPWLGVGEQQRFHHDGNNLLPWKPGFAADGAVHALDPGEALFVPYKAPHWVEVGEQPSISLSLTWSSQATHELEAAWQLHGWLRRRGLPSRPPPPFPGRARFQAALRRGLGRLGLV